MSNGRAFIVLKNKNRPNIFGNVIKVPYKACMNIRTPNCKSEFFKSDFSKFWKIRFHSFLPTYKHIFLKNQAISKGIAMDR